MSRVLKDELMSDLRAIYELMRDPQRGGEARQKLHDLINRLDPPQTCPYCREEFHVQHRDGHRLACYRPECIEKSKKNSTRQWSTFRIGTKERTDPVAMAIKRGR